MQLADTIQQAANSYDYYTAEVGHLEDEWETVSTIITPESAFFENALNLLSARYPAMDSLTLGATFANSYAWSLSSALIIPFCMAQRVPSIAPDDIAIRYRIVTYEEDGETYESKQVSIRFLSRKFAALPDDPCAGQADVTVLADRDVLRESMRRALEAHFAPIIERIKSLTGLGHRAQWNLLADGCATAFLIGYLAAETSDEAAQEEGLAFIKSPASPMAKSQTNYITLEYAGICDTFRARGGCCRYYTLPEGYKCSTCVLQPSEERDQRLLDYMKKKYTEEKVT